MNRQLNQVGCCHRRKRSSHMQNTLRKNQQILDTYIQSPKKLRSASIYEIIERQKLQALKKKKNDQYVLVNPNYNYIRRVKTENRDLQDRYEDTLLTIKKDLKDMKKDLDQRKSYRLAPIVFNDDLNKGQFQSRNSFSPYQQQVQYYNEKDLYNLQLQVKKLKRQISQQKRIKVSKQAYYLPTVNKLSFRPKLPRLKQSFLRNRTVDLDLQQIYIQNPQYQVKQQVYNNWKAYQYNQVMRKIRKVVNVIKFTVALKRFASRLKIKRESYFKDNLQGNIYAKILTLREYFLNSTKNYFKELPKDQTRSLVIVSGDSKRQREVRVLLARKFVSNFIDLLTEIQFTKKQMAILTQTCYYVCGRGCAGAVSNYFSTEELDMISLNRNTLRVRAQKYLQKCQIITFVLIKLLCFNILLRNQNFQGANQQSTLVWKDNIFLVGCLFYQLSRSVQVQLMKKVPSTYEIGNWKHINFLNSKNHLNNKKAILHCKSMVIGGKINKKFSNSTDPNQLIQGTISKIYLSEAYEYQNWQIQEEKIKSFVNIVHKKMCAYHGELKKQIM